MRWQCEPGASIATKQKAEPRIGDESREGCRGGLLCFLGRIATGDGGGYTGNRLDERGVV